MTLMVDWLYIKQCCWGKISPTEAMGSGVFFPAYFPGLYFCGLHSCKQNGRYDKEASGMILDLEIKKSKMTCHNLFKTVAPNMKDSKLSVRIHSRHLRTCPIWCLNNQYSNVYQTTHI